MTEEQEKQALAATEEILSYARRIYEIAQYCSKRGYLDISVSKNYISFNNNYYEEKDCIIPINYSEFLKEINNEEVQL